MRLISRVLATSRVDRFQSNSRTRGFKGRSAGLMAIASSLSLTLLLTGLSRPALAQPYEVCGTPCSTWAAEATTAPALAGPGTSEFLAWKGESSNYVYYTYSTGSAWANQAKVTDAMHTWYAETDVAPALASFGPNYVLAWKGWNETAIWYAFSSAGAWSQQASIPLPGAQTSVAPALASSGGTVYLAWTTLTGGIEYITYRAACGQLRRRLFQPALGPRSHQRWRYTTVRTISHGPHHRVTFSIRSTMRRHPPGCLPLVQS
jgi:hypothetical protein